MPTRRTRQPLASALAPPRSATRIALLLLLWGCDGATSGTYADVAGVTRYTFSTDGTVHIQVMGTVTAGEYLIDGRRVILSNAQGTVVLTRHGDRLIGPMGLTLNRVDADD